MQMLNKPRFFVLGILILLFAGFTNDRGNGDKEKKVFPKPEKTNMLFYVQRTFNINTLVYELNLDEKQLLNEVEPIKIYWINYATNKSTESLNYIQRKYAYGLDIKLIDAEKKSYCFNFVSYKKKKLYLLKSPVDSKYHVFCDISGKTVALDRIFIQIEGGSFWVPKVRYIDISGKDLAKNEEVAERVIP
ncbi:MAG TPA: DUF4833 domain-containing protein [Bacteroidia bacterium]|nr:DUF4833 domain-containing protein [Bacteroidia bacterium]